MRILGVEFGAWSLKAVEMESKFRRFEILDFHEVRLPLQILDPLATYRDTVSQLMARLPSVPEKVATSLPPSQTALRFLKLPAKQRKAVERMYRYELEDNLPLKLDESIVEHYVQKADEGSLVLAAVAPKKLVQSQLDWIKAVGLDPDWLTFDGMGMLNVYLSRLLDKSTETPPEPVLLLDIGHVKTNIAVLNQDRLEFFRSIAWGGAAITSSIALTMGLSLEDAEQLKIKELRLDADSEALDVRAQDLLIGSTQALSTFVTDLTHALVAYRNLSGQEVKSVQMTGGTTKTWGLDTFLSAALQLPVTQLRSFAGLNLKEDARETADEARFAEPMGRALVFARKTHLLFNFRREELSKETSLLEISDFLTNPNTVLLLRFTALVVVILMLHVSIAKRLADRELTLAQEDARKVFAETFRSVPSKLRQTLTSSPTALKAYIDKKNVELRQRLKIAAKGKEPILSTILGVSNAFPPDVKVDVNTLQLDDQKITLEGVVYEGELNRVLDNLKSNKNFANFTLEKKENRFTLKGEVVGR